MDMNALAALLEVLLLERRADGRYTPYGVLPTWCHALALPVSDRGGPLDAEEAFPFLTAFAEAAFTAWERGAGRAVSGFWTESAADGTEYHLEATAVRMGDARLLLIIRNERLYREQARLVQRGRELRLTHDALMHEMEQKDVLLHTIVHELADILTHQLGTVALLAEQPLKSQSSEHVRRLLFDTQAQKQIIGEILDIFSAERSPPPSVQGCTVDLRHALADAVDDLSASIQASGVRVETKVRTGAAPVRADARRLTRVVSNVLQQAVRHSRAGQAVQVDLAREGEWLLVCIDDEGLPLPPDRLPHLFEKFVRGRDGAPVPGDLGLYFCRISVERWGGGIGYETGDAGGNRYWIRLPLAPGA